MNGSILRTHGPLAGRAAGHQEPMLRCGRAGRKQERYSQYLQCV